MIGIGRGFLVGSILALSCAACDGSKQTASVNSASAAAANTQIASSPAGQPPSVSAGYSSRENDTFYYQAADGTAVGVKDAGWSLGEDSKFVRVLSSGNEIMRIEVGGNIVHTGTLSATPGGVVRISDGESYPLDGASVAAVAMRDALAGHLTAPAAPPSMADYQAKQQAAQQQADAAAAKEHERYLANAAEMNRATEADLSRMAKEDQVGGGNTN